MQEADKPVVSSVVLAHELDSLDDRPVLTPVLLLAYYYPPRNTIGAARPSRFARYLRGFGYDCEVVSSGEKTGFNVSPGVHQVVARDGLWHAFSPSAFSIRVLQKLFSTYNDRLTWISPAVREGIHVIRKTSAHLMISTSPPVATHLAALRIKQCTGVKWVADFRDPLSDNPFRSPLWNAIADPAMERLILHQADRVIANTDAVAAAWGARYPQWKYKICVIENGFDPDEPLGPSPLPERNYKLLVYAGEIYGTRYPADLFASMLRLLESGRIDSASHRIKLVGPVREESPILRDPAARALVEGGQLSYDGRARPRAEALDEIAKADSLLYLDFHSGLQVPAKLFEYLRIGRPILAFTNPGSPAGHILENSGIPFQAVHPGESNERKDEKLLSFLALPPDFHVPSDWFLDRFNGQHQTQYLARLLDELSLGGCAEAYAGPSPDITSHPVPAGKNTR